MKVGEILTQANMAKSIGERNFHAGETLKQIQNVGANARMKYICWGAKNFFVDRKDEYQESTVMGFEVSGLKLKGFVFITLGWNDTYNVYFTDVKGAIVEIKKGIYFDMINEVIDNRIEKQGGGNF